MWFGWLSLWVPHPDRQTQNSGRPLRRIESNPLDTGSLIVGRMTSRGRPRGRRERWPEDRDGPRVCRTTATVRRVSRGSHRTKTCTTKKRLYGKGLFEGLFKYEVEVLNVWNPQRSRHRVYGERTDTVGKWTDLNTEDRVKGKQCRADTHKFPVTV